VEKDTEYTKVIFKKWPKKEGGDVIAFFPEVPEDSFDQCASYQHIGQHSGATISLIGDLRRATPEEYQPLFKELEGIGYRLKVCKRLTLAMYRNRHAELVRIRQKVLEASRK